jgi:hypothetical protein
MTFPSVMPQLALIAMVGMAAAGCQSLAIAMDDPAAYDSAGAAQPASLNAYCASAARDAALWGTLPSAWCAPYGPYWYGSAGGYPYAYYGRPYGKTWRGFGGAPRYRGYPGRGFGGGWRGGGGRGGRR